ncbi:anhydro-N-acetylmuramic acid kinase [Paenibacillus apiarius]|uniref:Anhydro-N-acetylmuramic acid kinase n=1 Tax=Paenibacillus apiarius TaxID=46240 RepID=A0ABT4DNT5_9BACL|nr:anhydro-N-acetylmuramic acid kinase [Paenibacillus apiarius]MCY9512829.1 anhydro-N-acetylmuramic acid kinase [Paenibacillus apiarius]MCY9519027.1 anhydro-N-acetylmuramic acid kinase [Paenibacillus apiarius]MCY9550836.1 anhydro-N-acetylmuramic acid kinase [Paenibacillus apiarius]MCY9559730.1 anhydro-N-acetylmuramic acid kinase [Paenibacillus apiarius]MCY9681973.1 anhydro-N-acetylmuramic acid kinase [Paenibacillus apiarius]
MRVPLAGKPVHTIIGLMSGTSLDGIDAAVVQVRGCGMDAKAELLAFHCMEYESELRERLKALCSNGHSRVADLCVMNAYLGRRFAEAAQEAAESAGLPLDDIDFISSHGQTVWHQPAVIGEEPYFMPSTLQIGDLSVIAKLTGKPVIGDYRPADMAVGGQGAPLTPYADYTFFRHDDIGRIVQNIGGIGNCTILPAGASSDAVTAFDTGPGNMLIDEAIYQLSDGALHYDRNGEWAAQGKVNEELLLEMLAHPYFRLEPAKTTGREMFGREYAAVWIAEGLNRQLTAEDIAATFTALTVRSIACAYREFVFGLHSVHEVIVSGGGANNSTLMRWLAAELPEQKVMASDEWGLSGDAKEAVAFALLANDFVHGVPNNLPAVTGAASSTVMGKLALP